ncbi:AsmA-like C-terminal region-containing protein [Halomonas sp. HP20-15]|uniref:YhdP family phospholipid transporter n=1 Tax=Halomonas sp. HP20-15 TaxID=3085901 RepID=UPI002980ABD8|nr:AsmA-like C-terminal region-containing protein [Halomonas sp. HP20-15]MDW5378619.1 AsmA-like C-terminal region-containing protein [Halomonas sp. HP20-15]
MSPIRLTLRWALTLAALALVLLALLLGGLRLAVEQLDGVRERIGAELSSQFNATLAMDAFEGRLQWFDPALRIDDLRLMSQAGSDPFPLLEIEHADMRLDTSASLLALQPVLGDARISQVTLHLYQDSEGRWQWPGPAELPSYVMPEGGMDLSRLDYWVELLLRQRVLVSDLRLVLHGLDETLTLRAPQLLIAGGSGRAHLEGQLFVAGQAQQSLSVVLEVLPGTRGLSDFSAALQARMDLGSLTRLGRLLTHRHSLRLEQLSGEAKLWARWRGGRIEDARLALSVPELAVAGSEEVLELRDIQARGQWLRGDGDAWNAWVNALSVNDVRGGASPLPEHLQLAGEGDEWWLRSSAFSVDELMAWRQRLPLPERWQSMLDALKPGGRVEGLQVGQKQGQWQVRAALQETTAQPWQDAPGGGPFDAWVEAEGRTGHVEFAGRQGVELRFPELFPEPLSLDRASGRVDWSLVGDQPRVEGKDLSVGWRGASVEGDFQLTVPDEQSRQRPGQFALNLDMRDVDATQTPLGEWLPLEVFDSELRDWLTSGITGYVPRGSLHFSQTLDGEEAASTEDDVDELGKSAELRLALDVERGHLPYDPEWPALDALSGHLSLHNQALEATVTHAETLGLVSEGAKVALADDRLTVEGPVGGPVQALFDFLAAAPIDGMDGFGDWRGDGRVDGQLRLGVAMDTPDTVEEAPVDVDLQASVDAPSVRLPQADLELSNVNGALHYRHLAGKHLGESDTDTLTGQLGARVFEGPLLADFDVGGRGVTLEGRALARGLLDWGGVSGLDGLLSGYFPYTAELDLEADKPSLTLDSDLQGLAIHLPTPFGKTLDARVPLHVTASIPDRVVHLDLADRLRLRWRSLGPDNGQGQAWLENWPVDPEWPSGSGWEIAWNTPRLLLARWQQALAEVSLPPAPDATAGATDGSSALTRLRRLSLRTNCLHYQQRCLGDLQASASPLGGDGWSLALAGSLMQGRAEYRPLQAVPLDITLARLNLDPLLAGAGEQGEASSPSLQSEIITAPPEPAPLPDWLTRVPAGRLSIATLARSGHRFGPFEAHWRESPDRLRLDPVSLKLGEITAQGELVWEASGEQASLTRSRLSISGGDLGTALAALDQPVAISSTRTDVQTQLAWPGAPWQFALARSRGSIEADLSDGRFRTLESPSARLVGLLNVDNLLRRLRLDFSDVTGEGTAFDSVSGDATLYGGRLETRGPVEIDGTSTHFTLNGSVNLLARQLDLTLGVTVPVSQNLPLAAVIAGAPYVGGALFLADKVFGGWLDKVTRIYYRVQGPWTSPRITVEDAE